MKTARKRRECNAQTEDEPRARLARRPEGPETWGEGGGGVIYRLRKRFSDSVCHTGARFSFSPSRAGRRSHFPACERAKSPKSTPGGLRGKFHSKHGWHRFPAIFWLVVFLFFFCFLFCHFPFSPAQLSTDGNFLSRNEIPYASIDRSSSSSSSPVAKERVLTVRDRARDRERMRRAVANPPKTPARALATGQPPPSGGREQRAESAACAVR